MFLISKRCLKDIKEAREMAVTRKPKKTHEAVPAVDVEALIRKGGSVAGEGESAAADPAAGKAASVILRLPPDVIARVDRAVQSRRVKIPRHTWLLEAVVEKLDREAVTHQQDTD
jgi:hypothetical protein